MLRFTLLILTLSSTVAASAIAQVSSFKTPVERNIEGWKVLIDPDLLAADHQQTADRALKALANHLQRVTFIVPAERVAELQKLRIWVDLSHELKSMQYHPSKRWLTDHGYNPKLAKCVHIPRAAALFDPHMWAKHPYCVLHELVHAYHDQVLDFEHPQIKAAYDNAKQAGILEDVLAHTGNRVKHYGLTNHKEYFAESTEAYFGVNDFYPFVRAELKEHDPRMFATLVKVWGPVQ